MPKHAVRRKAHCLPEPPAPARAFRHSPPACLQARSAGPPSRCGVHLARGRLLLPCVPHPGPATAAAPKRRSAAALPPQQAMGPPRPGSAQSPAPRRWKPLPAPARADKAHQALPHPQQGARANPPRAASQARLVGVQQGAQKTTRAYRQAHGRSLHVSRAVPNSA